MGTFRVSVHLSICRVARILSLLTANLRPYFEVVRRHSGMAEEKIRAKAYFSPFPPSHFSNQTKLPGLYLSILGRK